MTSTIKAARKVMVIDDDPVVARSVGRVLSGKGYAVITAGTGEEALRKLHDEAYDLVYADIKMPGMSGLDVAEHLKASQPWLPVVIVTGYGSDAHQARADAAGVKAFLRKPLSPEMIEDSAIEALRTSEAATAPAPPAEEVAATPAPVPAAERGRIKDIALFLAAPFIGLAYLIAFPLVGLAMLTWMGAQQILARHQTLKQAVLMATAPLLGLIFVLFGPFIGLAALAREGVRALKR